MDLGQGSSSSSGHWIARLATAYQLLFVPYATVYLISLAVSVIGTTFLWVWGVDFGYYKLFAAPIALFFAGLLFVTARAWRNWRNRRARKRSLNQNVALLSEINTITFFPDDIVEVSFSFKLKALTDKISNFRTVIGWNGDPATIATVGQDGCQIHIERVKEGAGQEVIARFVKLARSAIYTFSYTLRFNNADSQIRRFVRKTSPYLPEDDLILALELRNAPTRRFVEAVYPTGADMIAIDIKYRISETPSYSYSIKRPIQGFSYKLAVQDDVAG